MSRSSFTFHAPRLRAVQPPDRCGVGAFCAYGPGCIRGRKREFDSRHDVSGCARRGILRNHVAAALTSRLRRAGARSSSAWRRLIPQKSGIVVEPRTRSTRGISSPGSARTHRPTIGPGIAGSGIGTTGRIVGRTPGAVTFRSRSAPEAISLNTGAAIKSAEMAVADIIEHHQDQQARIVGGKKSDERRHVAILEIAVGDGINHLRGAGFSRDDESRRPARLCAVPSAPLTTLRSSRFI